MKSKVKNIFDSNNMGDDIKNCYKKPTVFSGFGRTISKVVAFDENGCSGNVEYIKKQLNLHKQVDGSRRYFTLTGCLFPKPDYDNAAFLLSELKKQYFPKKYRRVVLHTRDIRKSLGDFNFAPTKRDKFMASLSKTLGLIDCTVISMTFDLKEYVKQGYTYDPYRVAFDFLLKEIYCLTNEFDRVTLVFEARGKQQDYSLLNHIAKVMCVSGLKEVTKENLQRRIRGVFFNPKFPDNERRNAYPGIEVADLFSYPIHRFLRDGKKCQDFLILENKIAHYPNYIRKGLRVFPAKWEGRDPLAFVSKK
jgi:hypothetical protein